jgi:branched-chain amino acid transport system substrate-binding protein
MLRRTVLKGIAATAAGGTIARPAIAQQPVLKIGMSMPMTGAGFNAVGRQLKAAIQLYMQQHGDTVAGRKIELTSGRRRRRRQRAPHHPGNDRQR